MKYQGYPAYKDSGIEWLGEVPAHWNIKKMKFIANVQPSNVDKKTIAGEISVLLCNYTDVYYNDTVNANMEFMKASATEEQIKKFTLRAGDTIITKDSEDPNDIAIPTFVPEDILGVICGYHLAIIRPNNIVYGSYIKRVFECSYARAYFATRSNGLTRYGLGTYPLDNVFYPKPSEEEANNIANFLDHETAKIDTLIEKQQQLIQLLKEKRQAVISHAVTKGLNPNAPMRDSGVEWLGEVPEHWVITRAKFVSDIFVPQRNKPELNDESGVFWATMDDMKSDYIEYTYKFVDDTSAKIAGSKTLQAGSVIASCVGNFGVASINKIDVIINQQLQAFIPNSINAEYLRVTIEVSKDYFESIGTAATLIYVNQQGFENLPVLVPPEYEQDLICEHINKECSKFDTLIAKAENVIQLIQERRTALISAAVTGKIDVRNWQPPKTNTSEAA